MFGNYRSKLLLLAILSASSEGFIAVRSISQWSSPSTSTSLAYSPQNEGGMETSNTRTLLPLSNIVDTETFSSKSFANSTSAIDAVNRESLLEDASLASSKSGIGMVVESVMNSYLGPRLLLAAVACLYGTNFPLGSIMDHALPASAATSARMVFAAAALSPFIRQIPRELIGMSLLAGCFTASGYVTQSMALVDTSPATVSFLGAATVIWCPFLEWLLHKTPMGWKDRPQTWVSAFLCLLGVGILELCGSDAANTFSSIGIGDGLALLQAMGFGTGLFLSEQMMKKHPTKALPITSVLVATTAFIAMVWSLCDGWIGTAPGWESMTLPNLLIDPSMREVALAVVWTGVISTSLNFFLEIFSLGKVPSGEASVILATEPLWAAAFASLLLGEEFGWNDYVGGFLIVAACIANSRKPSDFGMFFSSQEDKVSP